MGDTGMCQVGGGLSAGERGGFGSEIGREAEAAGYCSEKQKKCPWVLDCQRTLNMLVYRSIPWGRSRRGGDGVMGWIPCIRGGINYHTP